ncbi:MAG TPA: hypothetical protein VHC69_27760 [Polyangiaceae bacterium]|nr:hypothetical protein [Polyangiaceae bacterium]
MEVERIRATRVQRRHAELVEVAEATYDPADFDLDEGADAGGAREEGALLEGEVRGDGAVAATQFLNLRRRCYGDIISA